jgi:aminoglycoside 6'-N-acetyltransferase I
LEGRLAGFAEVRLRSHADECAPSPVAFLEGWYVDADARGCREFASDTEASNGVSVAAHRALGFSEGPPAINFRKAL